MNATDIVNYVFMGIALVIGISSVVCILLYGFEAVVKGFGKSADTGSGAQNKIGKSGSTGI